MSAAPAALLAALEASWPPLHREIAPEGLVLRDDEAAAGSRVRSSRRDERPLGDPEAAADRIAAFYAGTGGPALHQGYAAEPADLGAPGDPLEEVLAARGFEPFDPCVLLSAPTAELAELQKPSGDDSIRVIGVETPLAALDAMWAEGGVGPARRAVMRRALEGGAAGGVLSLRLQNRLAGAAFWAAPPGGRAVIHAVHVLPEARRRGGGAALLREAARRALAAGATSLCASTRAGNEAARAMFEERGFQEIGGYVYWRGPEAKD